MSRSNIFTNIENQYAFGDADVICAKTVQNFGDVINALSGRVEDQEIFMTVVYAAKIGIAAKNGQLNDSEKGLVDATFKLIWKGDMQDIYGMVSVEITEKDYSFVELINQMGNNVAMPFLNLILGFAYIDGKVDDKVLNRLDSLFGMNFLLAFMQSGEEDVPGPQIRLTGLEAEIADWFKSDDELRPLSDIVTHFPGKSKKEIKAALDSLCNKGILYGGENIVGCMYGLA